MDAAIIGRIALLGVLLCCSAFFSGSEVALFSLPQIKVESLRRRGGAGAVIARLLQSPRKILVTLLTGNEIVNVSIGAVSGYLLVEVLGIEPYQAVIATAGMVLVFGEITPKTIAFRRAEGFARLVSRPLLGLSVVLTPIRLVLEAIVDRIVGESGPGPRREPMHRQEFALIVDEMLASGEIAQREADIIHAILELRDTRVTEIMTPRTDMFTLPVDMTASEALEAARKGNFSRVPVVREDADHVEGILFARDLLRAEGGVTLGRLARPAAFVPEQKRAVDLLIRFRRERIHMAIVVDEFGGTAGIVTLDDVLTEMFGRIPDEFDEREASPLTKAGPSSWIVNAGMDMAEFAEATGLDLDCEMCDTVGGWALDLFGHLPEEGERVEADGLVVWAKAVRGTRILKLKVEFKRPGRGAGR